MKKKVMDLIKKYFEKDIYICIYPEIRQQIINDLRLAQQCNNEISKNNKFTDIHEINHLNLGKNWDGINDESRA